MIAPGSTIGILGGGQLGRMLAIAAAEMGYHVHIYCPDKDCPASEVAGETTRASYTSVESLERFAEQVDVITYEFENIPTSGLKAMKSDVPVFPSIDILTTCQHRVREKEALKRMGIATAPFRGVTSADELKQAVAELGTPSILKTAELGYDGKGQVKLSGGENAEAIWKTLGVREAVLEGYVDFSMEISVIVARNAHGETSCYPAVQNIHRNHILHQTIAPAPISDALKKQAEQMVRTIADGLGLVGLLAVEMFVTKDGIVVNELAPRPHNSGHWTIDACPTSQFAQTIRAVCGLPLGDVTPQCAAEMTNLIGDDINSWKEWYKNPRAIVHLYGKSEARAGRKMGHVTVLKGLDT